MYIIWDQFCKEDLKAKRKWVQFCKEDLKAKWKLVVFLNLSIQNSMNEYKLELLFFLLIWYWSAILFSKFWMKTIFCFRFKSLWMLTILLVQIFQAAYCSCPFSLVGQQVLSPSWRMLRCHEMYKQLRYYWRNIKTWSMMWRPMNQSK